MSVHEPLRSINPTTEETLEEFQRYSEDRLSEILSRAEEGSQRWSRQSVQERTKYLPLLKTKLLAEIEILAELMTLEMGKPLVQARAEIEKCASLCDYYLEHAPRFLTPQKVAGNSARRSYVRFDALGPILAVMPWNYPFWQVLRCAIPILLAGNVVVLKHASNVTGCALRLQDLLASAGFPAGTFRTVLAGREEIPRLVQAPEIRAVTLTGSEAAGRSIGEVAGRSLKKCVLELGGSDPFLVLPDVNLSEVVEQAVRARVQNNGQSCIAAKRFLVHGMIYDQFVEEFSAKMQELVVGDPLEEETQIGPLARKDLRDQLHQQVEKSVSQGARLVCGGTIPERKGWFYPPTILAEVTPEMTCFQEELFGPVASVTKIRSIDEGIELANLSRFGLGASLWTNDLTLAQEVAAEIESGCVFINQMVASHPSVPFGGVKDSGYGRELSHYGILEFVNVKTVWIH